MATSLFGINQICWQKIKKPKVRTKHNKTASVWFNDFSVISEFISLNDVRFACSFLNHLWTSFICFKFLRLYYIWITCESNKMWVKGALQFRIVLQKLFQFEISQNCFIFSIILFEIRRNWKWLKMLDYQFD